MGGNQAVQTDTLTQTIGRGYRVLPSGHSGCIVDLRALNTLWGSGQNEMGRRMFAVFVFSTLESFGWLLINSKF
jgi:hypothetical protein